MFGKKLQIGEGDKYDLSKVSTETVSQEEIAKKNAKLIEIFKSFDVNKDGKLSSAEMALALQAFDSLDISGDDKISKKEFQAAAENFNKNMKLEGKDQVDAKDLKTFVKALFSATKGDPTAETQKVIEQYNKEQEQIALQQKQDAVEADAKRRGWEWSLDGAYWDKKNNKYYLPNADMTAFEEVHWSDAEQKFKVMSADELAELEAAKAAEAEAKNKAAEESQPATFDYTVQNGESYNDLIKRILAKKGIENPTEEDIAAAKAEFEENNPGAVRKNKKGVEYLMVGDKVKLGADLGDLNNSSEQIGLYNDAAEKRREAAENAKYTVDAFYRNKDGSEGRRLKLKPTGEKAENGRYWAVDKQGNKYLVAHDGTILDAGKVAKKDAAVEKNKKMASSREQFNELVRTFNEAQKAFDAQVKKDGWAANTADAVSGFFGSTNTEDHVRADLNAYKAKLNELREALQSGDKAKFDALYKEISENDITQRVVKYNESQETGASVVKGVTVGVVSAAAAVATGGASLAVTAAVAGGTTFVSSVAAETADLATNDIDGDVNAENMGEIVNQAGKEALLSAATAGLAKGAGSLLSKTGSTAVNAGKSAAPALTNSADDAVAAGSRLLPKAPTGGAGAATGAAANTSDDVAVAGSRLLSKAPTGGAGSATGAAANTADDAAAAGSRILPKPSAGNAGAATGAADDAAGAAKQAAAGASKQSGAGATTGAADDAAGAAKQTAAGASKQGAGSSTGRTTSSTAGNTAANNADDAAAAARAAKNARDLSLDDIADMERAIQNGKISNADMSKLVDITKMSRAELSKMSPAELSKAIQSKGGLKELFTKYKASFTSDIPKGLNWAKQNPQAFKAIADKVNNRGIASLSNTELKQLADVLEMPVDALKKMSKANYRKLSIKFHPDKNSGDETATQIFQMLSRIYAG